MLYKLTEKDRDTLNKDGNADIIAAGPWMKGPCTLPHRRVLRDVADQFIVHTQCLSDTHAYFVSGYYFPKNSSGLGAPASENAAKRFAEKVTEDVSYGYYASAYEEKTT